MARIEHEVGELESQLGAGQAQTREARARLEEAVTRMGDQEQQRQRLDAERRNLLEAREEARANARVRPVRPRISMHWASNRSVPR